MEINNTPLSLNRPLKRVIFNGSQYLICRELCFMEKRRNERIPYDGYLKVYTSMANIAYTVDIKDISQGGAYIKARHLPQLNETITYIMLNKLFTQIGSGTALVIRVKESQFPEKRGFAIKLTTPLDEALLNNQQ